jgi:hypothetical protein
MVEARSALGSLLSIAPGTTISQTRNAVPWKDSAVMERYVEALRKAGLPE